MADLDSSTASQNEPLAGKDWEGKVRETFYRLYVKEDNTLPEVMKAMELLGFRATERQYKRKITAWRLDKKIKDHEMRAMLRLRNIRIAQGKKKSVFYVRGRRVDPAKMDRFARRKRYLESQISREQHEPLPADIRCCTPANDYLEDSGLHSLDSRPGLNTQTSSEPYESHVGNDNGIGHSPNLFSSHSYHVDTEGEDLEPPSEHSGVDIDERLPDFPSRPQNQSAASTEIDSVPAASHQDMIYGLDPGYPDLDLPCNVTVSAMAGDVPIGLDDAALTSQYYAEPVQLRFSRQLSPFPDVLRGDAMNILYFHFFINHTARLLMVHDCHDNPFRTILPQMALEDPRLLDFMLTYSAVDRARLLKHPVPYERVARWTRPYDNVFSDQKKALARIILLTSLAVFTNEDLTPYLGRVVGHGWQSYLLIARDIILRRASTYDGDPEDQGYCFLLRWFARLDVFGSLSDQDMGPPVPVDAYWPWDATTNLKVDCLLGTSRSCITVLAKVATLVRKPAGHLTDETVAGRCLRAELRVMRSAMKSEFMSLPYERLECSEDGYNNLGSTVTNRVLYRSGMLLIGYYLLPETEIDADETEEALHDISTSVAYLEFCSAANLLPMLLVGVRTKHKRLSTMILNSLKTMENLGLGRAQKVRRLLEDRRVQRPEADNWSQRNRDFFEDLGIARGSNAVFLGLA